MSWFLSHRQATGQYMAMALYQELSMINESAFLDVKCRFDLHELQKLVANCEWFILFYSGGLISSQFCHQGKYKPFNGKQ